MAARKLKIDLLLKQDFTKKSAGKLLLWALTVGRYIAIFTELVVIAGVIARFTLDYQRNRITEDILEQKAILASYRPTELRMRRLNEQFSTISRLEKEQVESAGMLEKLAQITPLDLRFESLKLDQQELKIEGLVLSSRGLAAFLSGLQSLPDSQDIVLQSVETGGLKDPTIKFSVSVEFIEKIPTKAVSRQSVEEEEL